MHRFLVLWLAAALTLSVTLPVRGDEVIRIKGSDTIGGQMMPEMAEAYRVRGFKAGFEIAALGSGTAFVGLFDGSADIGESSRPINEKEMETAASLGMRLTEIVIGYDGVAVIVNPANPVKTLSIMDMSQLFTGKIRNWRQLGGQDRAVRLISRPSYSGTHSFFKEKALRRGNAKGPEEFAQETQFMEENGEIIQAVASDPGAVSYVGLGWVKPTVKALSVTAKAGEPGIQPNVESVRTGRYPLYRALLMYVPANPKPATVAFLRFVLSPDGASVTSRNGFIPPDASAPLPAFIAAAPSAVSAPSGAAPQATGVVARVPAPSAAAGSAPAQPVSPATLASRQPFRVTFPFGKTTLTGEASDTVDQAADQLRRGGYQAVITGHADAKGTVEANRAVALARARAVFERLVTRGVAADLLKIESSGAEAPVASNETPAGRAANRRVDIELVPVATPAAPAAI